MENIIKGWITSLVGLAIFICAAIHAFGIYEFPNPGMIDKEYEVIIAAVIGLALFLLPKTKIEEVITKIVSKKSDQI